MNYWKIGSRWSEDGNSGSSILDVFRRNKVVFAGSKTNRISNEVKEGDFIAISDGKKIVCIAKATDNPKPITEISINEEDKKKFNYEDWVIGVKVNIVDLKEFIPYRIGIFHRLNEHREILKEIYENTNKQFEINAKTCTIINQNEIEIDKSILDENIKYIIPIYQRPYSWGETQLTKFLNDIFSSYKDKEPMFFGTMQFAVKEYFDGKIYQQQIIDGQQRLTTILVFLKILSLKYKIVKFNWAFENFKTEVNNEIQNNYFKDFIDIESIEKIEQLEKDTQNTYIINANFLNQKFQDFLNEDENAEFDVHDFLENHFFKNLFFVVIETRAGLSKTLQIFDTINTTGLDLKGADVFKIRMYEYLTDVKKENKDVFESINQLYENVDKSREKGVPTDMNQILSIYQIYLIGKYDLNATLYTLNVNTFFERLFNQILKVNEHQNFENINDKNVELSIDSIQKIINAVTSFDKNKPTGIEECEKTLIHWSRYGRYWLWIFILYLQFGNDEYFLDKRKQYIEKLSKMLCIYSVFNAKAINEIHIFMRKLNSKILNENLSFEDIIKLLNNKIEGTNNSFENEFSKPIAGNGKWKNIICRTSAMLEEKEDVSLKNKIFEWRPKEDFTIDIEHIQSFTDEKDAKKVREYWENTLNSIGNLIVLEYNLNRAIKNDTSKKDENYAKSEFQIMKNFRKEKFNPELWTKEKAEERKLKEIEKLKVYYYGNSK
jgi:uncharacterized protein with ParB-like and HNH nuclease domain